MNLNKGAGQLPKEEIFLFSVLSQKLQDRNDEFYFDNMESLD